jgi:hypothetical protein
MSKRRSDRPSQIGEYWLSKRTGSEHWQRTWFDAEASALSTR